MGEMARQDPGFVIFSTQPRARKAEVFQRIHADDDSTNRMANHSLEISALISISDFPNTCQGAGLAKKTSICAY